jgi:hypothetical protein
MVQLQQTKLCSLFTKYIGIYHTYVAEWKEAELTDYTQQRARHMFLVRYKENRDKIFEKKQNNALSLSQSPIKYFLLPQDFPLPFTLRLSLHILKDVALSHFRFLRWSQIKVQGVSKRALQLSKSIHTCSEDMHSVLNCHKVAKHTDFYLG